MNGLYDLSRNSDGSTYYKRIVEIGIFSFIFSIIVIYLAPQRLISPKTILLLNILIGYGLMAMWRRFFSSITKKQALKTNILFVGDSPETDEIVDIISKKNSGFHIVGTIGQTAVPKAQHFPDLDEITNIIIEHKVHIVVIAQNMHNDKDALQKIYDLLFTNVQIVNAVSFYENITGRIPPYTFSEGWFISYLDKTKNPVYQQVRTVIDYLTVLIVGTIMVILFPIIATLIKISSPGPMLILQTRVGKNGKVFTLYKFRSMYALSPDGSAEMNGVQFAMKGDKRVTPLGKFMRKTRIDELPQIWNLLKRDITLIGPRPERPEIVEELKRRMPYYSLRHTVLPGLTGWAVIHQDYTDTFESSLEKLQYDLYYIKNRSFSLDISICLKTLNTLLRLKGQ
jgi:exopolysaccharide biosynthesis polyprenyl glycosylphosphotransferase